MIISKQSVLPVAVTFLAATAAIPLSNSSSTSDSAGLYSNPGTLDANRYDIKIGANAVVNALGNVEAILHRLYSENDDIGDCVNNATTPQAVSPSFNKVALPAVTTSFSNSSTPNRNTAEAGRSTTPVNGACTPGSACSGSSLMHDVSHQHQHSIADTQRPTSVVDSAKFESPAFPGFWQSVRYVNHAVMTAIPQQKFDAGPTTSISSRSARSSIPLDDGLKRIQALPKHPKPTPVATYETPATVTSPEVTSSHHNPGSPFGWPLISKRDPTPSSFSTSWVHTGYVDEPHYRGPTEFEHFHFAGIGDDKRDLDPALYKDYPHIMKFIQQHQNHKPSAADHAIVQRDLPEHFEPLLHVIIASKHRSSADSVTVPCLDNVMMEELRKVLVNMTEGILQAGWGVKGNLADAADRVNDDEADKLVSDMSAVLSVGQGALHVVHRIEETTNIHTDQNMKPEIHKLAIAIGQLWVPFKEYYQEVVVRNGVKQDEHRQNLGAFARYGSSCVYDMIRALFPSSKEEL